LIRSEAILGLPGYEVISVREQEGEVRIAGRYAGTVRCPHCGSGRLRKKDQRLRSLRHENWGQRHCMLELESGKWQCRVCGRYFWQRFPGILPRLKASEAYRRSVFLQHWDGVNRSRLSQREGIGSGTVERWFQDLLQRKAAEKKNAPCPRVLGIDEHFFTRRLGYATTLCDLRGHKVYDVVLGRSELALEPYLERLEGKQQVQVVCMDLAPSYRAIARKYFPNARIVADRFHVIRVINQHFLGCWREIDPVASKHRGLVSLMRRHRHNLTPEQQLRLDAYFASYPAIEAIYRFKQKLCYLLLKKHRTRRQCAKLAPRFLRAVHQLRQAGLAQLVTLGQTLHDWREEIADMWRFTRNNGITEGFHTKREMLQRQAFGLRNFENYRLRVKVLCS
jgi:transposase